MALQAKTLLYASGWKIYADTIEAIRRKNALGEGKEEHKSILKKGNIIKKVTFASEEQSNSPKKKETKRLKSPPREKNFEEEKIEGQDVPKVIKGSPKIVPEKPQEEVIVERNSNKKKVAIIKKTSLPSRKADSSQEIPIVDSDNPEFNTGDIRAFRRGFTQPERKEEKTEKKEEEENKAPKPPKQKIKKQVTMSGMYAKMKEIHKKRKELLNIGGSARDLTKKIKK